MFTNCGGGGGGPSAPPSPPSFDIALDTTGLTISPGYSGTFNITLQPRNGFSGAVTVTISGFPQGVTATPASPFQLTGTTQKVTLTAASSTVTGNYAVSFQAKSGSLSASASMALQVEDLQAFFLSLASQELALDSGSSGSISFSVLNDGGALNYTLNLSVSGLPTGASASATPVTYIWRVANEHFVQGLYNDFLGRARCVARAAAGSEAWLEARARCSSSDFSSRNVSMSRFISVHCLRISAQAERRSSGTPADPPQRRNRGDGLDPGRVARSARFGAGPGAPPPLDDLRQHRATAAEEMADRTHRWHRADIALAAAVAALISPSPVLTEAGRTG